MKQQKGESIGDYLKILNKLSEYCQFKDKNEFSKDQFIWGIFDENIKRKLLAECGKLDLRKCVKLAQTVEMTNQSVSQLSVNSVSSQSTSSARIHHFENRQPYQARVKCYCCGEPGHTKPACKFKSYQCNKCKKSGHLAKLCKASYKKSEEPNTISFNYIEDDKNSEDNLYLNALFCVDSKQEIFTDPVFITLNVNNESIKFLADQPHQQQHYIIFHSASWLRLVVHP